MTQDNGSYNYNIAQAILEVVQQGCKSSIKTAPFNSCLRGVVSGVNLQGTLYTIKVGQKIYSNIPALKSAGSIALNSSVICIIPNNNVSQMFILGVLTA